jgi:adenylate cyclase
MFEVRLPKQGNQRVLRRVRSCSRYRVRFLRPPQWADSSLLRRCSTALNNPAGAAAQSWQQVLRSLNAKGGERKRLTILFADIRNSTGLIDSLGDPELGMRRPQPVLDLMNEAVIR